MIRLEGALAMKAVRLIRETVELRDGRRVTLRPIRPEDAPRLMDLHTRLSTESQYFRFFGPKPQLSPAEAEYLANVDFTRRFAVVASVREDEVERLVAVGRFDIHDDEAEPAIVVRDDYQGSGLGTAILERMLEIARGRGVQRFSAEILAENRRMLELLSANGLEVTGSDGSVVRVSAPIEDIPILYKVLKIAARPADLGLRLAGGLKRRPQDDDQN